MSRSSRTHTIKSRRPDGGESWIRRLRNRFRWYSTRVRGREKVDHLLPFIHREISFRIARGWTLKVKLVKLGIVRNDASARSPPGKSS